MRRRGGDKLFNREKELGKKAFKRQKANKHIIPDVIIACEDAVSAPTYFQCIVDRLIEAKKITQDSFVIAKHQRNNPTGVLKDLKSYKSNGKSYKDFDHKWIVIDRDAQRVDGGGHPKEDFNNALQNAKDLKVQVAYSNDAFELWYLLHFDYRNTPIFRDAILKEVIKKLKEKNPQKFAKLDKNSIKQKGYTKKIYDEIVPLQDKAIRHAKKLLKSHGTAHNPESDNPSTTVFELVEVLEGLGKKE